MNSTRPPPAPADPSGLLRHGSLLMVGTLAGALCNAAFHMVTGRALPAREYGALAAMLSLILAFSQPLLALQNTLAHDISRLCDEARATAVPAYFRRWLHPLLLLLIPLCPLLTALARHPLADFFGIPPALLVLTALVLPLALLMSLFNGLWQGMQSFVWFAFAPQVWGILRLLLSALFILMGFGTAFSALSAQAIGIAVVITLGLLYLANLRKKLRLAAPQSTPASPLPAMGTSLRYLLSACICLIGYGMLMNLDNTLAHIRFTGDTVDLFARAATIARTAIFLPVPIAAALFPKVTSDGSLRDGTSRLLLRALAYTGLLIAAVVAVCLLFPALPWTILYGPWAVAEASQAAHLTRAMTLAMSPLSMAYLLLNFEMAQNRFRWALWLLPCACAYILGVALGAPRLGIMAIPVSLAVASLLALLVLLISLLRRPK